MISTSSERISSLNHTSLYNIKWAALTRAAHSFFLSINSVSRSHFFTHDRISQEFPAFPDKIIYAGKTKLKTRGMKEYEKLPITQGYVIPSEFLELGTQYLKGEPGDYIGYKVNDPDDVYIIAKNIFADTYKLVSAKK